MQSLPVSRRLVTAVFLAVCLSLWVSAALAQAPSTVIHIINVKWKEDASPEQIQAVIDAVRQLPSKYPGLKRVWTKDIKYQGQEGYKQAIVMEFESQDALKKYEDSSAQQWWYKIYLPVRDESRTHDVTN
jgi:stress responsive alpha/beta barrel protein